MKIIQQNKNLKYFPSFGREDYLSLLKYASCLIGNSSSGIIEAPSFGTPVINIGTRQQGREHAVNVVDVPEFRKEKILNGINYVLYNAKFKDKLKNCENPYGDGRTSERICKILKEVNITDELLQKRIVY